MMKMKMKMRKKNREEEEEQARKERTTARDKSMDEHLLAALKHSERRLQYGSNVAAAMRRGHAALAAWRTYGQSATAMGYASMERSREGNNREDIYQTDESLTTTDSSSRNVGEGGTKENTYTAKTGLQEPPERITIHGSRLPREFHANVIISGEPGSLVCSQISEGHRTIRSDYNLNATAKEESPGAPRTLENPESGMRSQAKRLARANQKEPLFWFEAMPSMYLRTAQKEFREALIQCAKAASEQQHVIHAVQSLEEIKLKESSM